jgi:putative transposase
MVGGYRGHMCPRALSSDPWFPKTWPHVARAAVLHAVPLASTAMAVVRGRAVDSRRRQVRQHTEVEQLRNEITLLQEELRLKDARMGALPPPRRPRYRPVQRMAILELRAQRGWSLDETAQRFLVEPRTIAAWMKRLDEQGERALVQTPTPANKYPDFVHYLVQRLRVLCPLMGKRKIAETLARAGLHLGTTTVQRMSKDHGPEAAAAKVEPGDEREQVGKRTVTASYPDHVWNVDLTVIPTRAGFWTMLGPFSWLQRWPFCYWLAVVVDHFSRRAIGFAVFLQRPTAKDVNTFLGRTIRAVGGKPRYVITDKGKQLWCDTFEAWCRRRHIRPGLGAVRKYGSFAVVERFIRSMKNECCRRTVVPMQVAKLRVGVSLYFVWYNHHRPHQGLAGRTPDEVYFDRSAANEKRRYEPRRGWPRNSACAAPQAKVKGRRGVRLDLRIS